MNIIAFIFDSVFSLFQTVYNSLLFSFGGHTISLMSLLLYFVVLLIFVKFFWKGANS